MAENITVGANSSFLAVTTDTVINQTDRIKEQSESIFLNDLPIELSEISDSSFVCIIAYSIVFVIATSANVIVLRTLWRKYKRCKSRITLLLLNLTIADLIVCCTLIPTEVFWRLTIQWWGGNFLCKGTQFLRAFGLYLSSLVLICVSFDRFLAIMHPLNAIRVGSYRRIKLMLELAWSCAVVFSVPQAIFFSVETHPEFPSFKQCVTNDFLNNSRDVKIYSIFSVTVMYFIPLLVILCTYTAILLKLVRKSNERSQAPNTQFRNYIFRRPSPLLRPGFQNNHRRSVPMMELRCSSNAESNMSKAKTKSLFMSILIVAAFVICWTPYAVMTLWYMVDWHGAAEVNPLVQEALFLMAVANSCINPLIYSGFANFYRSKQRRREKRNCMTC